MSETKLIKSQVSPWRFL